MTPKAFFLLVKRHALWFALLPCITAGTVFFLTRNEPKMYLSKATLYTGLASGYTLLSDQQNGYKDVSNAFDNLLTTVNSTETLHQIGISLLTKHLLLDKPDNTILGPTGFAALQQAIPANVRASLLKHKDADFVYYHVDSLSRTKTDNPIKKLIQDSDSYYSIGVISENLAATRRNNSDMLDMEYQCNDPGVAQQTLTQAIDVLHKRYYSFKTSETNSVVSYYQDKVQKNKQKLDETEAKLQAFNVQHNVLNFEEDSKNVTASQEVLNSDYNQEMMRNKAAKAAIDALERRMAQTQQGQAQRAAAPQAGTGSFDRSEINAKQEQLAAAENQLISAQAYGQSKAVTDRLQSRVQQASDELKKVIDRNISSSSAPGVAAQPTLANEWTNKVLEYEESSARLKLYKERLGENQNKAAQYGPLESQYRQLTRDLAVIEKEYLSSVQSLNQANTHRQDISVGGSLEILDSPNFPIEPEASKRILFIAISLGIGIFIAFILAVVRYLLNRKIGSPEEAEAIVGKPVVAAFPLATKAVGPQEKMATQNIFEQLGNLINLEILQTPNAYYPPIVAVASAHSQVGKTKVSVGIANLYAHAGQRVAYCYPAADISGIELDKRVSAFPFEVRSDFMNFQKIEDLFDSETTLIPSQYDKIIWELPPLVSNVVPMYLVNKSVVSLVVIDAQKAWARTEKQILAMYEKLTSHTVLTVLNKVSPEYVDLASLADSQQKTADKKPAKEAQHTLSSDV